MSNVYGYPRIKFYTNDGTADAAKRAYDWFKGEEEDGSKAPFLLTGNEFVPNAAVGLDGNEAFLPIWTGLTRSTCTQKKSSLKTSALTDRHSLLCKGRGRLLKPKAAL